MRPWFDQMALPAGEHDLKEADLEQGAQGMLGGSPGKCQQDLDQGRGGEVAEEGVNVRDAKNLSQE